MIDPEQHEAGLAGEPTGSETQALVASPAATLEASDAVDSDVVDLDQPLMSSSHTEESDESAAEQPDDLHDLFAMPASDDPLAAMRDDPNYSALIKELEYIAAQARMLFQPAEEAPSDDVWTKIQSQLPTRDE